MRIALALIANVAAEGHDGDHARIHAAGGFSHVLGLLRSAPDAESLRLTAGAVMNLCRGIDEASYVCDNGYLKSLMELSARGEPTTAHFATAALQNVQLALANESLARISLREYEEAAATAIQAIVLGFNARSRMRRRACSSRSIPRSSSKAQRQSTGGAVSAEASAAQSAEEAEEVAEEEEEVLMPRALQRSLRKAETKQMAETRQQEQSAASAKSAKQQQRNAEAEAVDPAGETEPQTPPAALRSPPMTTPIPSRSTTPIPSRPSLGASSPRSGTPMSSRASYADAATPTFSSSAHDTTSGVRYGILKAASTAEQHMMTPALQNGTSPPTISRSMTPTTSRPSSHGVSAVSATESPEAAVLQSAHSAVLSARAAEEVAMRATEEAASRILMRISVRRCIGKWAEYASPGAVDERRKIETARLLGEYFHALGAMGVWKRVWKRSHRMERLTSCMRMQRALRVWTEGQAVHRWLIDGPQGFRLLHAMSRWMGERRRVAIGKASDEAGSMLYIVCAMRTFVKRMALESHLHHADCAVKESTRMHRQRMAWRSWHACLSAWRYEQAMKAASSAHMLRATGAPFGASSAFRRWQSLSSSGTLRSVPSTKLALTHHYRRCLHAFAKRVAEKAALAANARTVERCVAHLHMALALRLLAEPSARHHAFLRLERLTHARKLKDGWAVWVEVLAARAKAQAWAKHAALRMQRFTQAQKLRLGWAVWVNVVGGRHGLWLAEGKRSKVAEKSAAQCEHALDTATMGEVSGKVIVDGEHTAEAIDKGGVDGAQTPVDDKEKSSEGPQTPVDDGESLLVPQAKAVAKEETKDATAAKEEAKDATAAKEKANAARKEGAMKAERAEKAVVKAETTSFSSEGGGGSGSE